MIRPRRSRRGARILSLAVVSGLALLAIAAWQPPWAIAGLAALTPGVVWRVETEAPVAAITFDDGPDAAVTGRVLDVLREHDASATFFLIAGRARAFPGLVARIRAEGHEIGNHHMANGTTLFHSRDRFARALTDAALVLSPDTPIRLYRPPGGLIRPDHARIVRARGYTIVLGDAHPYDPSRPPPAYMEWLVHKNLRSGSIVVLHDGAGDPARLLAALPAILAAGRERGLRWVTVTELLAARYAPHPGGP